jgi:ferredoxin-NADP reductase
MAKQIVKFIISVDVAEGTKAFHFEKPTGFEYKAGQTIDLYLINPPETDAEGNSRAYSIASAPHEGDIMIATRMRDTAFKRVLGTLEPGAEVEMDGPFGDFTLHNNVAKPAVFLTGGIGITPVRAILHDALMRKLEHKINVFYSNRRPEDAAFLAELTELVKNSPNIKFIPTMTNMDASKMPWRGKTGYITAQMMKEEIENPTEAIYYLDGPAAMVAAMRVALKELAADEDNIRTEEFSGY